MNCYEKCIIVLKLNWVYLCFYSSLPFCAVLGLTGCKKEIPVSDFQRHVLEDHGKRIHIPNAEFGTSYFFRGQLKPQTERNQRTVYKFFNICLHKNEPRQIYFILRIAHKRDLIIFSVFYLGGKKTAEKHTYEIGITDLNDVSSSGSSCSYFYCVIAFPRSHLLYHCCSCLRLFIRIHD